MIDLRKVPEAVVCFKVDVDAVSVVASASVAIFGLARPDVCEAVGFSNSDIAADADVSHSGGRGAGQLVRRDLRDGSVALMKRMGG
jgi:hypothetical protein